jgi:hypothetical protein
METMAVFNYNFKDMFSNTYRANSLIDFLFIINLLGTTSSIKYKLLYAFSAK